MPEAGSVNPEMHRSRVTRRVGDFREDKLPGSGQARGGALGPLPPGGIGRLAQAVAVGVPRLASDASLKSLGTGDAIPEESVRVNWHSRWLCPVSQCSLPSPSMCTTVPDARASSTASAAGRAAKTAI